MFGPLQWTVFVTGLKADLVAWGAAFIGVALVLYAYRRIQELIVSHDELEKDPYAYDPDDEESFERALVRWAEDHPPEIPEDFDWEADWKRTEMVRKAVEAFNAENDDYHLEWPGHEDA